MPHSCTRPRRSLAPVACPSGRSPRRSARGPRRAARRIALAAPVLAVCAALLGLGAGARADWQLDTRTSVEGASGPPTQRVGRLIFDPTHLRMEFGTGAALGPGPRTVVLFDAESKVLRAVDDDARSYVQLDRAEIELLARRVAEVRREMQSALPALPPEEQAAVRQMIEDMRPDPHAARPKERVVAQTETRPIDAHAATLHDLMLEDRLVGEVWVAPLGDFGLQRSDLAVFEAFSRFQSELIQQLGVSAAQHLGAEPLALFERVDGLPLLVRRIDGGRVESETRFGPLQRIPPDPQRFRVPAGYRRSAGPGGAPSPGGATGGSGRE